MAEYEDKVLHELDGIKEYDNPMPGWLMAIWWGSLIFSAAYLIFYALSFGEGSMEAEYRGETQQALAAVAGVLRREPARAAVAGRAAGRRREPRGPGDGRGALRAGPAPPATASRRRG